MAENKPIEEVPKDAVPEKEPLTAERLQEIQERCRGRTKDYHAGLAKRVVTRR